MILGATLAITLLQAAAAATTPPAPAARQPLTKATVQAGVKTSFDRLDTNKDGWVDKAEAQKAKDEQLAAAQKSRQARATQDFAKLDTNKDGSISKAEFDASYQVKAVAGLPWIDSRDSNKDGRVSLAEATAVELAGFDRLDRDKNGQLTQQEARAAQRAAQAK